MICQNCGKRDAVTHITQITEGAATEIGLCEVCALEKGIQLKTAISGEALLGGFLATIWKGADLEADEMVVSGPCSGCGATFADFRQTGRFGCAQCWRTFEPAVRILLRRYHGSTHHVGRAPSGSPRGDELSPQELADQLREQLHQAVESENFEVAAQLRDRLKELP